MAQAVRSMVVRAGIWEAGPRTAELSPCRRRCIKKRVSPSGCAYCSRPDTYGSDDALENQLQFAGRAHYKLATWHRPVRQHRVIHALVRHDDMLGLAAVVVLDGVDLM